MSFLINTNVTALNAANNLSINSTNEQSDISHLSSGLRINSAADDAAGLVISNSLSAQSAGLTQATRNTNDAINVVKTADSALAQVSSLLTNIRQLVLHAANTGANNAAAAAADEQAINQAVASIDRISQTTQFNGKNLLDGSASSTPLTFQIGANGGQTVAVTIASSASASIGAATSYTAAGSTTTTALSGFTLANLATAGTLDVSANPGTTTQETVTQKALAVVDQAIQDISTQQANLGAIQNNELQTNVQSLATSQTNTESSLSTIKDVDLAATVVDYTKNQILVSAGTSALSYANQAPQSVLKLLQ